MAPQPKWMQNAVPGLLADPDRTQAYLERMIDPLSPRRRWHMGDAAERAWFYYGNQWIQKMNALAPGGGAYHFASVTKRSLAAFPQTFTNLVAPAVDNDVARLSKKEYVPETSASKNEPRWIAAASAARDILLTEAQDLLWAPKREQTVFNLVLDGTAIVRTYRDELETDCAPVAALNAVCCGACELKLASNNIPFEYLADGFPLPDGEGFAKLEEGMIELPGASEIPPGMRAKSMRLKACPMCKMPMKPYAVSREEAEEGRDSIGNRLGQMLPKGENAIEVVSMHDFYPENGGVRIEPHECRIWGQMTVRPLEEIIQRHPELEDELEAEDPLSLLRLDPLYSGEAFLKSSPYGKAGGLDTYANHARVREMIVKPQKLPGLELGAWFIRVGEGRIISKPLCVEMETEHGTQLVPRVKYHIGRYKRIPGQFWGTTFVHNLIPINKKYNEICAQGADLRERGKPMIVVPEGVEFAPKDSEGGSLGIVEYDDGGTGFDVRASLFPGTALTANPYYQELMHCLEEAKIVGAPQDIEVGASVGGIKTTSGLMLVSEEASQKRGPMERGLVGIYEGVFQHLFDMTKLFQVGGGTYERRSESGFFETQSYENEDLVGTTKVRVTARTGYDQKLYTKEATAEAVQMGLYDLSSPVAKERALENMNLPKINEPVGVQIKRAEMAWAEFVKNGRVPIIDESLFDVFVWFDLFGKHWLEDEALLMQRDVEFDGFFARVSGWQDELAKAEAQDQMQRMIYGSLPPDQWETVSRQVRIAYEQAKAAADKLGAPPEAVPQPPPPPPVDGFLPRPLALRIIAIWERMLGPEFQDAVLALDAAEQSGIEDGEEGQKLRITISLLQMRAVIEALAMLIQRKQAALVPSAPAPGSPAPAQAPSPAAPA